MSKSKPKSVLSLSQSPDDSSAIYKYQTLRIFVEGFEDFKVGKVIVEKDCLKWSCPYKRSSGSLSIPEIFEQMESGKGLFVGDEADLYLKEQIPDLEIDQDRLICFCSSLFLLFPDEDQLSVWTNDFLSLLNSTDISDLLVVEPGKYWIFDLSHNRQEESIEVEATFIDANHNCHSRAYFFELRQLESIDQAPAFIATELDPASRQILQSYLVECLRRKLADCLSRDILQAFKSQKKISLEFVQQNQTVIVDWYRTLEKQNKAAVVEKYAHEIKTGLQDSVMQCFRLLEMQKAAQQIELKELFSQYRQNGIDLKIKEIEDKRALINNRRLFSRINKPECGRVCNCTLF